MLDRAGKAGDDVPRSMLEALLDNIGGFGKGGGEFADAVRGLVSHRQPAVRAAALRCLGSLQDPGARALVLEKLRDSDEDPRVRREAAGALGAIAGADAVEPLVAAGSERLMTNVVIPVLAKLGSKAAVPWLRDVAEHDYNWFTRRAAKGALTKLGVTTGKKKKNRSPKTSPDDE